MSESYSNEVMELLKHQLIVAKKLFPQRDWNINNGLVETWGDGIKERFVPLEDSTIGEASMMKVIVAIAKKLTDLDPIYDEVFLECISNEDFKKIIEMGAEIL